MLMVGWDLRRSPAIWTVGTEAAIYIRPILPPAGDLRLEMELGGNGALLSPQHQRQRAIVKIDGRSIGTLTFSFKGANSNRFLGIPRSLVGDRRVIEIAFELPDAVSPRVLGLNNDDRLLGLYVSSIRVVSAQ
jgi:hypothetical protein